MRPLTTEMTELDKRPYFMWDEDISIQELKQKLHEGSTWDRERLMGKMLREARDVDVWHFVTPKEVARMLPVIERRIGRRLGFWQFLIQAWYENGLLQR